MRQNREITALSHPAEVRPFGRFGGVYRVNKRGLFLYRTCWAVAVSGILAIIVVLGLGISLWPYVWFGEGIAIFVILAMLAIIVQSGELTG
jgi:hypothetical protein